MNILITGGAGFIGSNLTAALLKQNQSIICIDNFNDFYDPGIKRKNVADFKENPLYTLYEDDILNRKALDSIFSEHCFDLVIHLAARAGVRPSIDNALLYEEVNVAGTVNLLDCCRKFRVNKFIFASSSSVYGGNEKTPFSETDNVDNPVSPYAATKKAGELICFSYNHLFGISVQCLRFFTVYGPGQRPEMAIHKFTKNIFHNEPVEVYGDGLTFRDYTYIDDITGVISSNVSNINGYEIINLGNSSPVSLKYIIALIEKQAGKKASVKYLPFQQGDMHTTFADISKAKKMLKYNPVTSIEEGINKFVSWYRQNGLRDSLK
jgi:UDP-glucuronate 4-epimerase